MATGRVVIDIERCKGCELCRDACPQDVLALAEELNAKGYRPVVLLDPAHNCTGCALCATVCPDGCITVYRDVVPKAAVPKAADRAKASNGRAAPAPARAGHQPATLAQEAV
ncbi:MAG: ferredoxin family protein [Candidatus Promineofilum sp.]|nr:ferredoxin family protein [Promineifilum sp.]